MSDQIQKDTGSLPDAVKEFDAEKEKLLQSLLLFPSTIFTRTRYANLGYNTFRDGKPGVVERPASITDHNLDINIDPRYTAAKKRRKKFFTNYPFTNSNKFIVDFTASVTPQFLAALDLYPYQQFPNAEFVVIAPEYREISQVKMRDEPGFFGRVKKVPYTERTLSQVTVVDPTDGKAKSAWTISYLYDIDKRGWSLPGRRYSGAQLGAFEFNLLVPEVEARKVMERFHDSPSFIREIVDTVVKGKTHPDLKDHWTIKRDADGVAFRPPWDEKDTGYKERGLQNNIVAVYGEYPNEPSPYKVFELPIKT